METKLKRLKKKDTERFDKTMEKIKPFVKKKKLLRSTSAGKWFSEEQLLHRGT